ncbi:NADH-quinone oxidoreductase subunit E [Desulfacinum infernum DSM 9756]|uniref:NADH-quinone oxidoreductase subunit E n=1 Tax=Desulfacinum infernum DSM 9756 TaxID=1121391 RepID=A0A1M5B6A2_9BACT|nr:NADH-quinone oxidoreductase subunit NuoE [Desulfacinum infernum]SHF37985.1 NADH-quinone oxidoreductase subunit E [Desulfacinum infernum DSM 9756]
MKDDARLSEEETMLRSIEAMLPRFEKNRAQLIPILQAIQEEHQYLSREAMRLVADYLEISPSEVLGVATFYNQFRFHPPGRHQIKVCLGTACHVAGGDIILENFERKLGIREGETTPDREYSVERVACVGCCALAPVAVVDDKVIGHMQPSKIEGLFLQFDLQREQEKAREAGEEADAQAGS